MVCFLVLSQRITLTKNITSICKSKFDVVIIKAMRKRVLFFKYINSKTETVTEVGYAACGPLRTSDVLIPAALLFLGSNRFPVGFHCTPAFGPFYPRLTQLILRIVDVSITCQFLIMIAHPQQTFLSF